MASSSSSSSSSSMPRWKYDVFLSFRGKDIRNNFVCHLYAALQRKGIYTFMDDKKLELGKSISPELRKAIQESRFAIIVFSKNYSSSSWCLDELVEILQCKDMTQQTVLPIFYDVTPSEVRKQKRSFAEAFGKHEESEKLNGWRAALQTAGNLAGLELSRVANGNEMACIQTIVQKIFEELGNVPLDVVEYEVGIDSHVNKLIKLLDDDGLKDVRVVGIHGMGGIGKTTIAKAVFNRIFNQFENNCFLGDVRENSKHHGLAYLQEQLLNEILQEKDTKKIYIPAKGITMIKNRLCRMKVLVVLDDVNESNQLDCLARDRNWFGSGSKIIITTRNECLFKNYKVDEIYKVEPLNCADALELFSWHAFKTTHPPKDKVEISYRVIDYAKGLPLALKVLGSLLHERNIQEWESEINKLKKFPNREIVDVLRVSYDSLDYTQKQIFLDIACLFKGKKLCEVKDLLTSSGFYPDIGISVLVQRSLIAINTGMVCMHDLIQELGKEIVFQESPKDPGNRSRLWDPEDICKVLIENKVTNGIEGIMLNTPITKGLQVHADAFETMTNLRVLKINNVCLSGRLTKFSSQLIYVDWDGFPLSSLPFDFNPEKLVQFYLRGSRIKQMWPSIKILNKLKILDLSGCQYLEKTPDFSGLPSLESLNLEDCTSLVEVHPSIAFHERLIRWKMRRCKNLRSLPRSIKMKSLAFFFLTGCSNLQKFPEIEEEMSRLCWLDLSGSAIKYLPSSIEHLIGLQELELRKCKEFTSLRSSIYKMKCLEVLDLSGSNIASLPACINQLTELRMLYLDGCSRLQVLTSLPSSVSYVSAQDCKSLERVSFPPSRHHLRGFILTGCPISLSESLLQEQETEETHWIVLSGSEIPEWFSSKSEGSSVSLWADPHSYSKLKGIAVCAVLDADADADADAKDIVKALLDLEVNGYSTRLRDTFDYWVVLSDSFSGDVIQFHYKPGPFPLIHDSCYIKASITQDYMKPTVKMCGIRLVMEKQDENP